MGFNPKIKIQLFNCKTCGRPFNNALSHVCKINLSGSAKKTANARKAAAKKKGK